MSRPWPRHSAHLAYTTIPPRPHSSAPTLIKALGADKVIDFPPRMASEDVGVFALPDHEIPLTCFILGAMDPLKLAAAKATDARQAA